MNLLRAEQGKEEGKQRGLSNQMQLSILGENDVFLKNEYEAAELFLLFVFLLVFPHHRKDF